MGRLTLLALAGAAGAAMVGCDRPPPPPPADAAAASTREPPRHGGSISDPRAMESVTGALLFEDGCWVVASGPARIALFFPREARLVDGQAIQVGKTRLREGDTYKFVGDLSETAVDSLPACNDLPSSMAVGDVWAPQPEQQRRDSLTP